MTTEHLSLATIVGLETNGSRYLILKLQCTSPFPFQAGQYTQIVFEDEQGTFKKYYSIACAPQPDHRLDFCLTMDDLRLQRWVMQQSLGAAVRLAPAAGRFHRPSQDQPVVMLAGGSGITPLRSMLEARVTAGEAATTQLLYGCQSDLEMPFRTDILALQTLCPALTVTLFAEQVHRGLAHLGRPIDHLPAAMLPDAEYVICGPSGLMQAAQAQLEARGVPPDRIHKDRF